jgi:hypothetical protein
MTSRLSSSRARSLGVVLNLVVILSLVFGPIGLRSSAAPASPAAQPASTGGGDLFLLPGSHAGLPAAETSVVTTASIASRSLPTKPAGPTCRWTPFPGR